MSHSTHSPRSCCFSGGGVPESADGVWSGGHAGLVNPRLQPTYVGPEHRCPATLWSCPAICCQQVSLDELDLQRLIDDVDVGEDGHATDG